MAAATDDTCAGRPAELGDTAGTLAGLSQWAETAHFPVSENQP